MTEINGSVLTEALREHADVKLQQEIREWLIYAAPKDVTEIFTRYTEKMEAKRDQELAVQLEIQRRHNEVATVFTLLCYAAFIAAVIYTGWMIYEVVTVGPLAKCVR